MLKTYKVMIPKLTGRKKRKVYIYLPESYEQNPEKRYPVLYMFDGHNVFVDQESSFGKSWGLKNYMDFTQTELIVVGLDCNHDPDNGRLKEYAPYSFSDPKYGKIQGKGKLTMDWIVRWLKPQIDRCYRTLPEREFTFIGGSSMGGLMSLYALLAHNDIFSRAAALSPSLWANKREIDYLIRTSSLDENTILYMDYGSEEFSNHKGMKPLFFKTVSSLLKKGVFLTSRVVPYGDHSEASWEKQLSLVIETLIYDL
ncbi:MAG: alpha/beta hydrolase-fold protein [Schaedlerella sp.]|nr:alpha/beta hydrolase-fold protein [Schaedlerella sp.]